MIWVLAGTRDGREIVNLLCKKGYHVLASTVTSYGEALVKGEFADRRVDMNMEIEMDASGPCNGCKTLMGALDLHEMVRVIREEGVDWVIDATHPFAEEVSKNAQRACRETEARYVRFERDRTTLPLDDAPMSGMLIKVNTASEAAEKAVECGDVIFLTTGSKTLDVFVKRAFEKKKRVIARVLPDADVIRRCLELGLLPRDIVAMQGPFSKELNKALLQEYNASVMVTKESGRVGGTDTKIAAALELGIPVVLIERPEVNYERVITSYEGILSLLGYGDFMTGSV
ncbi:MAG: precorrin-6A reductase [Firmicutes bacterium]|nr:precorrin-6A reductase [Bacillota bacterium]